MQNFLLAHLFLLWAVDKLWSSHAASIFAIHIHQSIELTPRVTSGVPFPQLSYTRMLLLVCPCQTIGVLSPAGGAILGYNILLMAIMCPQGNNDYVAALGAMDGYSLTARQSAGTYRAASIDQDK